MPTQAEIDIFADKLVGPVARLPPSRLPPKIVGFFARKGAAYDGQLMIVGRAVNGFILPTPPGELQSPEAARKLALALNDEIIELTECPLAWVRECWGAPEGYNTARSAFWRVARRTAIDLGIAEKTSVDWPSRLVWSNLYKIAPDGGNPSPTICSAQEQGCIELLREELSTYRPKRLLFLTGLWATPFLKALPWVQKDDRGTATNVHLIGTIDDTQVVVATHPMCKAEDPWVAEVVDAFHSFA